MPTLTRATESLTEHPPAGPVWWIAETEVDGTTRAALVRAQHAARARRDGALQLEQPLHELVRVRRVDFRGVREEAVHRAS